MKTCARCKTEKQSSDFHRAKKSPDGLQSYCKDCSKSANKIWLDGLSNDERKQLFKRGNDSARNSNRDELNRRKRIAAREIRIQAIDMLGGKCYHCGITDIRVLEIDHIYGGGNQERKSALREKTFRSIVNGDRLEEFQALCANCHRIKTYY